MKAQEFRRGAWTPQEDSLLRRCIESYGEGKWHLVAERAGLNRCRKSCRLRWINYLDPNVNRKEFQEDEIDLIIRMHKLLGNKWSLIAGRIPGRTANDIKNYFNTHLRKTLEPQSKEKEEKPKSTRRQHQVIRPVPRYPTTLIATGGPLIISGNQQQHLHREQPPPVAASPQPEERNEEPVIQNNEHTIWWDSAFKFRELEGVEYMNQNPRDITTAEESSYAGTRIDGNETTVCHDSTFEWCHLLEHHLLDPFL